MSFIEQSNSSTLKWQPQESSDSLVDFLLNSEQSSLPELDTTFSSENKLESVSTFVCIL
jgi:hypothetical protein